MAGATCRFRHTLEAASEGDRYKMTQDLGSTALLAADDPVAPGAELVSTESSDSLGTTGSFRNSNKQAREFDPFKALAISKAKNAQDSEERPWTKLEGNFYSIDVECVAIGYGHTDRQRLAGRVALVDAEDNVLVDEYVRLIDHSHDIVSYLTPLSGLDETKCLCPDNKSLDEIMVMVKQKMQPADKAVVVGQSIHHDIQWLGLEKGVDFQDLVDIGSIFRQRIPRNLNAAAAYLRSQQETSSTCESTVTADIVTNNANTTTEENDIEGKNKSKVCSKDASCNLSSDDESTLAASNDSDLGFQTRYRVFSLRHCCINLLNIDIQSKAHDPVDDARYSILLFQQYKDAPPPMLRAVRDALHRAPITRSFASDNPTFDGVCLSTLGYKHKVAARFIWLWWTQHSKK